jgi:hypothetical protein
LPHSCVGAGEVISRIGGYRLRHGRKPKAGERERNEEAPWPQRVSNRSSYGFEVNVSLVHNVIFLCDRGVFDTDFVQI